MFSYYLFEKTNSIKQQIEKAIDSDNWESVAINVARKNGFNPGSSDQTRMQGVKKIAEVMKRVKSIEKLEGLA